MALQGDFGPFLPQIATTVPLWLAMALKKRGKCTIRPPEWMSVGNLPTFPSFFLQPGFCKYILYIGRICNCGTLILVKLRDMCSMHLFPWTEKSSCSTFATLFNFDVADMNLLFELDQLLVSGLYSSQDISVLNDLSWFSDSLSVNCFSSSCYSGEVIFLFLEWLCSYKWSMDGHDLELLHTVIISLLFVQKNWLGF